MYTARHPTPLLLRPGIQLAPHRPTAAAAAHACCPVLGCSAGWALLPDCSCTWFAAFACCSPPTALCMLESVVELAPGDVVVQNGATSSVGQVGDSQAATIATPSYELQPAHRVLPPLNSIPLLLTVRRQWRVPLSLCTGQLVVVFQLLSMNTVFAMYMRHSACAVFQMRRSHSLAALWPHQGRHRDWFKHAKHAADAA